jgi:ribonucleotide reductase beta subunit family protein with ferritin-like domain
LKLFTKYEVFAGNEYWAGRFSKIYPRIEFQEMGACYSYFEQCVHKRFYQKTNELLHLHTDEFYSSFASEPVLADRVKFLDDMINDPDHFLSVAVFSMVEGAILYSAFAFLKHFQSQGKNKVKALVSGIDFSVRDENLHAESGAYVFRVDLQQSNLTPERQANLFDRIYAAARVLREHEHAICDRIFAKGRIEGITAHQLKNFVDSRLDLCLQNLGLSAIFNPASNPIADWFYLGLSQSKMHDFFSSQGNAYNRNWAESEFDWNWKPTLENEAHV